MTELGKKPIHTLLVVVFYIVVIYAVMYPFFSDSQQVVRPVAMPEPLKQRFNKIAAPVPDFSQYTVVEDKKRAFFAYLEPEINRQNAFLQHDHEWLRYMAYKQHKRQPFSIEEKRFLQQLAKYYKVEKSLSMKKMIEQLRLRVDVIPMPLVLVQAANESAWGTSRFAQKGYNFFGMWCYREGCGFVPKQRNEDAVHEVAKFASLSHAIARYLNNLNTNVAYKKFRQIRFDQRQNGEQPSADKMAYGLINYSQRREAYIEELLDMIRHNQEYF